MVIVNTALMWCVAGLAACGGGSLERAREQPVAAPEPVVVCREAEGEITTAADLLAALERADQNLRSLEAGIQYDRVFEIAGDRQIRTGTLYYADERARDDAGVPAGAGRQKFAIHFNQLQLDKRVQKEDKIILFDGQWLIEKMPAQKQFIKRRVVPDGAKFNPLKIGEGPLPLPIGQKKDDILERYDAELLPPEAGVEGQVPAEKANLLEFVKDAMQIKLTPKGAWKEADNFDEIRLWYRRGEGVVDWLPRMARTVNKAGDVSVVQLINLKINAKFPEGMLKADPPETGWDVRIEDLAP